MAEVIPGISPDEYGLKTEDILSSANIASTLARPKAKLNDILGIRKQAEFDVGYTKSKAELGALQEAARAYGAKTERGIQEIGDWRERAEAVVGEKRSYAEQRYLGTKEYQGKEALLRQQLGEQASEVQWRVGVAEQNINFVRELKLQYPGAGIKFGEDMNKIEKRIVKFGKEQKKKAEKEAFKAALRAMGKKTSGLSRRELERKLRKANKTLYEQTMKENELRLEGLELDIQNTRSIMANRGKSGAKVESFNPKSYTDTQKLIYEAEAGGESWHDIVQTMGGYGVDISMVDEILQKKHNWWEKSNSSRSDRSSD